MTKEAPVRNPTKKVIQLRSEAQALLEEAEELARDIDDQGEETSPLPTGSYEVTCSSCGTKHTLAYNPEAHADGTKMLFECHVAGCPSGGRLQDAELPAGDRQVSSQDSATGAGR